LLSVFATGTAIAQEKAKDDKSKTEPKLKAKERAPAPALFENDKVRVVETRTNPGERNAM